MAIDGSNRDSPNLPITEVRTHKPVQVPHQSDQDACAVYFGKEPWWKTAVFYQVYPASFRDSNADGLGDIPGVIEKLDYLRHLGVDCVWLSPVFDSPQEDMGYDVSDYQAIYPPYGTVDDLDTLTRECHARGMKLILDLVVNHTSEQHAWFRDSRSSKSNPKRDWYIWQPARYDDAGHRMPPTNWRGYFAGPTWTWDEQTQEYYLHLYAPSQPDLNWENPECRAAIYKDTMHFWLERGVDGFRIDTVNKYSKHSPYVDAPITEPGRDSQPAPEMWCNGPRIHEFIREMQREALAPYGAVSVGELSNMGSPADVLPYVSATARELDMVFEFGMIRLGTGGAFGPKYLYQPYPLSALRDAVARYQTFIDGNDGWTTVFCENHDNGRAVSRFGDDSTPDNHRMSARCLALWQATLTGTLFLYQGQEIGMANMPAAWGIDEYKDVESRGFYEEAARSGDEALLRKTMSGLQMLARDHARLPMQWEGQGAPNAGFSEADPAKLWMRVHDNYGEINVRSQLDAPGSVLEFWRMMLRARKRFSDLFVFGSYRGLLESEKYIYAYLKISQIDVSGSIGEKRRVLVIMNWSKEVHEGIHAPTLLGCPSENVRLLLVTWNTTTVDCSKVETLQPWEGRVYTNFDFGGVLV
ncbi:glycoside hydrolase superfamily [Xylariales sp. PMI_506]|nr:glycoside hydrolase superfamily [Xylariales sp. PMI_506]